MAFLAVRKVRYEGRKYAYVSPILGDGLNILEGENGTGKSTFASLIYFGLGGRVESFIAGKPDHHAEITGDEKNFVELSITIDEKPYSLKRFIGTNDIAILGDDMSDILSLVRRDDTPKIFSDWILHKLGIEPVSIQYGTYSGKLNITDFMRLIYHDQAPDPSGIFKAVDVASFVTDSRVFREAVFEILIGKSFQDYYTALAEYRRVERQRAAAAKALDVFKEMSLGLQLGTEDLNIVFLDKRLAELREQKERLIAYRRQLAKAPPPKVPGSVLPEWQRELLANQIKISSLSRTEANLLDEVSKLRQLKAELVSEATQLRKMMFAHEELNLFPANTCPYCLKQVERIPHRCICGSEVLEGDYEKFFYDSAEYLAILKSRQKNVETVEVAAAAVMEELDLLRRTKEGAVTETIRIEALIAQAVDESDSQINLQLFEEAEERLSVVREEIGKLEQQRELERRREALEEDLRSASASLDDYKKRVDQLATAAQVDIQSKRQAFSKIYNDMMRLALEDCRSASIGEDYMPLVNGGVYTEASAGVPRRLLYYASILEMSLVDETVKFPRFLLIDTPETSGIDAERLKAAMTRIVEVVERGRKIGRQCQVILTTGIGKRPDGVDASVFGSMRKPNERLLRPKS